MNKQINELMNEEVLYNSESYGCAWCAHEDVCVLLYMHCAGNGTKTHIISLYRLIIIQSLTERAVDAPHSPTMQRTKELEEKKKRLIFINLTSDLTWHHFLLGLSGSVSIFLRINWCRSVCRKYGSVTQLVTYNRVTQSKLNGTWPTYILLFKGMYFHSFALA